MKYCEVRLHLIKFKINVILLQSLLFSGDVPVFPLYICSYLETANGRTVSVGSMCFYWPLDTEAPKMLSKRCQKPIKNFCNRQRFGGDYCGTPVTTYFSRPEMTWLVDGIVSFTWKVSFGTLIHNKRQADRCHFAICYVTAL